MQLRFLAFVAAFAGLTAPAAAQSRIEVDASTGLVTCTTQPGRFAQRAIVARAESGRLAGRIRLTRSARSERWVPAAGFLFNAPGDRNAGVQMALSPDDPTRMLIGLRLPGQRELIQLGSLPANIWIPMSVALDAEGIMTVTVGRDTERRRVRLTGPIEPVIHCNSGTFEFRLDPGMRLADPPARSD